VSRDKQQNTTDTTHMSACLFSCLSLNLGFTHTAKIILETIFAGYTAKRTNSVRTLKDKMVCLDHTKDQTL